MLHIAVSSLSSVQEDELWTYQAGQKVEYDVEHGSRYEFDWDIGNNPTKRFREWVDKGVRCLLLNDGALVVEGVDFSNTDKSIHSVPSSEDVQIISRELHMRNWTYKTAKKRAAPLLWNPAVAFGVLRH
jgi:hypothetical protein